MKRKFQTAISSLLLVSLIGCSQNNSTADTTAPTTTGAQSSAETEQAAGEGAASALEFTPGTYEGTADGRIGTITVDVVLTEDAIESVTVKEHQETDGISDLPMQQIPADIVKYQSLGVDTITGATITSYGIVSAVSNALEASGADVAALRAVAVTPDAMATEDMETQVVVAGAGMAGLMAAVSAAHEGAEVILVEKLPFAGGSLFIAGGGMVTVDSEVIGADEEVDDSLTRTMDYMRMVNETSERQPDYDFVEYLLRETGKTIDYLANEFELEPTYTDRGDYIRTNFGDGQQEVKHLLNILEEKGVTVLVNTQAEEILMDNNQAVGLKVSNRDGDFTISADKVIIATGGASWDRDRLNEANPELATVALSEQAIRGNSGDGFTMLEAVGAQMGEGPFVKSAYPDFSAAFRFTWKNNPSVVNSLVIDAEGNRFANEAPHNSMMLNKNMLRHESPAYYALFDTVNTDETFLPMLEEMAARDNKNIVVHADTIEELAAKLEVDPATLQETFDRYQELCANGEDTDFGKDASHLIPYAEEGGYYAAYLQAASWGTIGGALTDYNFRVLDQSGNPIENLFAAGESATSTLFGDYYLGGFSLGFYSAAGRIAGETAVAELNAQ